MRTPRIGIKRTLATVKNRSAFPSARAKESGRVPGMETPDKTSILACDPSKHLLHWTWIRQEQRHKTPRQVQSPSASRTHGLA